LQAYQAVGKEMSRAKQHAAAEKMGGGAATKPSPRYSMFSLPLVT